ncbi:hypothetical protein Bca4012_089084 [Brassica carinata]
MGVSKNLLRIQKISKNGGKIMQWWFCGLKKVAPDLSSSLSHHEITYEFWTQLQKRFSVNKWSVNSTLVNRVG